MGDQQDSSTKPGHLPPVPLRVPSTFPKDPPIPAGALRVAIVGSRDFGHLEWVTEYVDQLPAGTTVVSGGARGVDQRAAQAARARGLAVEVFLPLWYDADGRYDRAAGVERNSRVVERAHAVVAFYSGSAESSGTPDVMRKAEAAGKLLAVVQANNLGEKVVRVPGRAEALAEEETP